MAVPVLAAVIARLVAGRAGAAAAAEAVASRAGGMAALRAAGVRAGVAGAEGEAAAGGGASTAANIQRALQSSTAGGEATPRLALPGAQKLLAQIDASLASIRNGAGGGGDASGEGGTRAISDLLKRALTTQQGGLRESTVRVALDAATFGLLLRAGRGGGGGFGGGGGRGLSPAAAGSDPLGDKGTEIFGKTQKLSVVFGGLIASTGLLTATFINTPRKIEGLGRSALESQENLRRFSGRINNAFAQLERADIVRMQERAEATSGSTSALARSLNDLGESTKEFREAGTTIVNVILIGLTKLGILTAEAIKMQPQVKLMLKALQEIENHLKRNSPEQKLMREFIGDLASGQYTGKHKATKRP